MRIQNFKNIKSDWNKYLHNPHYPHSNGSDYQIKHTFTFSNTNQYGLLLFNNSVILLEYNQQTQLWQLKYWESKLFLLNTAAKYTLPVPKNSMDSSTAFTAFALDILEAVGGFKRLNS